MTQSRKKAFDLTAVLDELDAVQHEDLIRAIKVFYAAESVELDLMDVAASVKLLEDIDKAAAEETSHIGNALLTHAVIVYARATHTTSRSRFNAGVTGAYDGALKAKHLEMVELRDQCLAHFGPGKDRWYDERIIYTEAATGDGLTATYSRTNFSRAVIENLDALLAAAIPFVKARQHDRADELGRVLHESDKQTWELIDKHPFDMEAFFKTPGMNAKGLGRSRLHAQCLANGPQPTR
ncbi:MAG: hypothetical protein EOS20_13270 [Mesorhizobium sp.]|uniref:hypothetical protein n=1 Tax=Mesorhizobium sp. TaxID=1871066 RepID=UPI000FE4FCAA|nr:hypothetical protein [Mesorhizobium sp.]RWQ37047.1 MAG: hypothetical protein EOS20_13270 [Mesorhizobium sp.]